MRYEIPLKKKNGQGARSFTKML